MDNHLKIFSGSSNPALAREICDHVDVNPSRLTITRFSNENIKAKIEENVRGDDVYVVQTSCPPVNDNLVELLIIIDALKYASAGRITAVLPYYPYVRSDKKDEPRIYITARLVADLLETAGADRILTMTLHAPQIVGFSRIPVDQLLATQLIAEYFSRRDLTDYIVVAPDVGSAKKVEVYARRLDLPMAIIDKRRYADDEKAVAKYMFGDVEGKNALLFDDEVLSGGTLLQAVHIIKEHGARRVFAGCVHGIFSGQAIPRVAESPIEEFVITNTIPHASSKLGPKFTVLSVAKMFGDAIKAIHQGDSVSKLFN
ncbi:MAG: phosphoribosylpyrophosphate synthetase [Candidatus Handelsmanbacteria bacterium RIFCSPLOWO2_12_FULL_64_10]|uniref:Ribose-phosphate pyrophosphokinase n=1 Tax=Handelsmanbacteria sp. (strain RIFCSPLOWO2_12_FULL_64_10) TaxID=1817868 RepID=A0A1F6CAZ7_HANXR|nr:MAG: phosphoribosylpyrophosphate synthetase [Candidatus Handelsmanbacteria bacterium RIFCSPLOWO2_12_FULL_64_10]